ncbi:uncharacterized protein LOC122299667 isoform X1 [Carya illinoinensis]|uniref:uncharacterized protein LOC122299667 isoform X1 n=1 Tax=Carya illinoinensis TaxID=32201 RepID=UPI001C71F658|nr:uncharacterized protein LOC122299667 isoform X1 [Carya illinoinensis]
MGGGISWWSEKPVFFKINRKSEADSLLKSSISSKLHDFLSDYSDDVLSEYITVLICNGKHQYQARDDLDAFLGERTAEFVTWLWDFLLSQALQSGSDLIALSDSIDVTSVTAKHDHAYPSSLTKMDEGINAGQKSIQFTNKSNKKVLLHESNRSPKQVLQEKIVKAPSSHFKSSSSGNAHPRNSANNVTGTSLSAHATVVVSESHHNERTRGSVWDRLGKPLDDASEGNETVDASAVADINQDEQLLNWRSPMHTALNGGHSRTVRGEVPGLSKNDLVEGRTLQHKPHPQHAANNIRRKRHFGDISLGLGAGSVSSVGGRKTGLKSKENLQDLKKPHKTSAPNLASEVLDVKQKLHQIETEMSRLRSRQMEMEKDGKPNLLLNFGSSKHLKEDSESRTVIVTNVHFAATKEALSLYFAKCGSVVNVVILTDEATSRRKGSAYVTFVSKESVDKALELSGSQFFSRTIKVLRKAESATATPGPAQHAGIPSQAPLTHINRNFTTNKLHCSSSHLQWRRVDVSVPSDPSATTNVKSREAGSSASQQQLPGSPTSVK